MLQIVGNKERGMDGEVGKEVGRDAGRDGGRRERGRKGEKGMRERKGEGRAAEGGTYSGGRA